jgi:hypothetical protein
MTGLNNSSISTYKKRKNKARYRINGSWSSHYLQVNSYKRNCKRFTSLNKHSTLIHYTTHTKCSSISGVQIKRRKKYRSNPENNWVVRKKCLYASPRGSSFLMSWLLNIKVKGFYSESRIQHFSEITQDSFCFKLSTKSRHRLVYAGFPQNLSNSS